MLIDPLEVSDPGAVGEVSTKLEYQEYLGSNNYYPFGMRFSHNLVFAPENSEEGAYWVDYQGGTGNKYTYNGKEEVNAGIDWQFYGARIYDNQIARFSSIDPISEKFAHLSTFNYADNNPIRNSDLHGLQGVSKIEAHTFEDGSKGAHATLNTVGITGARTHAKGTGLSVNPLIANHVSRWYQDFRMSAAATLGAGVAAPLAGGATAIGGPGLALSFTIELGVSYATGSSVDMYDAVAGALGPVGYALTTPFIDMDSQDGLITAADKGAGRTMFELSANFVGLGLGSVASKLGSKSSALTSKGHSLQSLSNSLDYYSHLGSTSLSNKASSLLSKGAILRSSSRAASAASQIEDVITKTKLKNEDKK